MRTAFHDPLKTAGLLLLLFPLTILLLFTVAEMASGDISGLQHLVQAFPLLILTITGWRWPSVAGAMLFGVGSLFAVLYPFIVRGLPIWSVLLTETFLFLPAILSGLLFVVASRREISHSAS